MARILLHQSPIASTKASALRLSFSPLPSAGLHIMAGKGWSQLPPDLLSLILEQFTTADRSRFRSVCVDWSFAPQELRPPPSEIPWLMLSPGDRKRRDKCKDGNQCISKKYMRFYSISDERTYKLGGHHFAEIAGAHSRAIVSYCQSGWLMYMDKTCELQCVHLPTGRRIQTPSIASFPEISGVKTDPQGNTIGYYIDDSLRPCDHLHWYYQRGIIIFAGSPPDHLPTIQFNCKQHSEEYVIFVAAYYGEPAFARQGDTSWTKLGINFEYHDIGIFIFHKGSLYAASSQGDRIYCIELNCDLSVRSLIALTPNKICRTPEYRQCEAHTYLVEIDDQLWHIWRFYSVSIEEKDDDKKDKEYGIPHMYKTTGFRVFKLDDRQGRWLEMESIGEYAIFIGNNYPMALSTYSFRHLDRDCIYFTDDHYLGYEHRIQWDAGIFSLRDCSIRFNYDVLTSMDLPQPTWVMPFSVCKDP